MEGTGGHACGRVAVQNQAPQQLDNGAHPTACHALGSGKGHPPRGGRRGHHHLEAYCQRNLLRHIRVQCATPWVGQLAHGLRRLESMGSP